MQTQSEMTGVGGSMTGWHVRGWSSLGWLETAVKVSGIGAALAAAASVTTTPSSEITGLGYAVVGVAGLSSVFAFVQLGLRLGQKELISLAFAVLNLLGHAALVYVVAYTPSVTWVPVTFGAAYVAGELIKQRFLTQTGYTESGQSTAQMVRFSRVYMGMHALMAAFALLS